MDFSVQLVVTAMLGLLKEVSIAVALATIRLQSLQELSFIELESHSKCGFRLCGVLQVRNTELMHWDFSELLAWEVITQLGNGYINCVEL